MKTLIAIVGYHFLAVTGALLAIVFVGWILHQVFGG
jgi:hypothetical protein